MNFHSDRSRVRFGRSSSRSRRLQQVLEQPDYVNVAHCGGRRRSDDRASTPSNGGDRRSRFEASSARPTACACARKPKHNPQRRARDCRDESRRASRNESRSHADLSRQHHPCRQSSDSVFGDYRHRSINDCSELAQSREPRVRSHRPERVGGKGPWCCRRRDEYRSSTTSGKPKGVFRHAPQTSELPQLFRSRALPPTVISFRSIRGSPIRIDLPIGIHRFQSI